MAQKIGVGIIGANPDRGWARAAHIPALAALPQYELRAVSTSRRETADAAGKKFDAPLAFGDHAELVAHPDVDLVTIAVKAPQHRELVTAALKAGKHVYCEWPLGNDLAEAVGMADLARRAGVRNVIGLQGRAAPAINQIRDMVAEGYVGEVLSTSVVASGETFGRSIAQANAYQLDKRNGTTLLSIQFGHFADAVCYCLGEFRELSATLATRRRQVEIDETGELVSSTSPDQVSVTGVLDGGAMASLHFRGGRSRGTNLLWEINGTEGDLVVTAPVGFVGITDLTLRGTRGEEDALSPLAVADKYTWARRGVPKGPPFNVAQLYARLADDIRNGTGMTPTFDTAVRRHRMLDAVQESADTGMRQTYESGSA